MRGHAFAISGVAGVTLEGCGIDTPLFLDRDGAFFMNSAAATRTLYAICVPQADVPIMTTSLCALCS